eukprot:gene11767-8956_t
MLSPAHVDNWAPVETPLILLLKLVGVQESQVVMAIFGESALVLLVVVMAFPELLTPGRTRLATQRAAAPSLSSLLSHDVADANPFAVLAEHQEDSEMTENAVGALGKRFLEDPQATTNRAACEPLSLPEPTQDFSSPPDTSQPTPPSTPTSEVASALKRLKEAAPDQKLLLAQKCLTALIMTVDNLADDSMENQFAITAIDALKSPAQAQLT